MATTGGIILIGLGNEFRGDDAAGLLVAQAIEQLRLPGVTVRAGVADGTELLDLWKGARAAFVVDCVWAEALAGTVLSFDALGEGIPEIRFAPYSTHALSVVKTVRLGRALGLLPDRLIVYGIAGDRFAQGETMSEAVADAVRSVTTTVTEQIRALTGVAGPD